jgi:biotin carboxyl carrier protein
VSDVRAEMAANVWKLVVAEGQEVAVGDPLLVLESMKMEIPVLAETAGTVTRLAVGEGAVVQEGDLLAVVSDR